MTKCLDDSPDVDSVAHALANGRRRAVVDQLSRTSATTTQLSELAGTSLPTMHQHLDVLRAAGLVRSTKRGRTMFHALEPRPLAVLEEWIAVRRSFWNHQLDSLADALEGPDAD